VWLAVVLAAIGAVLVLGRGRQISVTGGYSPASVVVVLGCIGTIIVGAMAGERIVTAAG